MQRDAAPHRRAGPAQCGRAAEIRISGLQRLHGFGVGPDHEVGVGAHARDVVEASDHHTAFFLLLEEGRHLVDSAGAVVTQRARLRREHRKHQVADGRVERVEIELGHVFYRATREVTSDAAALVAAATQAGTPMPSK
jgi:hypothetical protein